MRARIIIVSLISCDGDRQSAVESGVTSNVGDIGGIPFLVRDIEKSADGRHAPGFWRTVCFVDCTEETWVTGAVTLWCYSWRREI